MDLDRLRYLVNRYNNGELTKSEWQEFRGMLVDENFHPDLTQDMAETFTRRQTNPTWSDSVKQSVWNNISADDTQVETIPSRILFIQRRWLAYAASLLIILTAVWLFSKYPGETGEVAVNAAKLKPENIPHDVLPGSNRAVLTLSDGSTIYLDSAADGTLAQEGASIVKKTADGRIIYSSETTGRPAAMMMNTMTTPRGGQYSLVLADGSRVWLNAASSITYPAVFAGQERIVSITGEAYFEVARNPQKPFVVKTTDQTIRVLGTHFNVNAYPDETGVKTSLLEGKVKIGEKILKPGEAFLKGDVIATNVSQDVAWKSGVFDFDDVEFAAGLRQLARWYDLEIQYDTPVPKIRFGGKIDRDLNLSQVLKVIDGVGAHFRLEGKVLHVIP